MANWQLARHRGSASGGTKRRRPAFALEAMEDRCLLAVGDILFNPSSGVITIEGSNNYADVAKVTVANQNTTSISDDIVRVELRNTGSPLVREFALAPFSWTTGTHVIGFYVGVLPLDHPGVNGITFNGYETWDWFDRNLQNYAVRSLARVRYIDHAFQRADLLEIYASITQNDYVSTYEFNDLKDLTSTYLTMWESYRNLSNKVANGDRANQWYQGGALGNLVAADTGQRLNRLFPTDTYGNAHFAGWGDNPASSSNNELWVALLEKAYMQINESGWLNQEGTNSYTGIQFGYPSDAFRHMLGRSASNHSFSSSMNATVNDYNAGKAITFSSKDSGVDSNINDNHVYSVVSYNPSTQRFLLFEPHNTDGSYPDHVELTWAQIRRNFSQWTSIGV